MKKKTYRSKSVIALNVVMPTGKSRHVSFTAQSDGTSLLSTDDVPLQRALEAHRGYGRLFRLIGEEDEAQPSPAPTEEAAEPSRRTVEVSDLGAAKDYLADTFGVSRTSLRTRKSIEEAAAAHGIEFEGI